MILKQILFCRSCALTPIGFLAIEGRDDLGRTIRRALEKQERNNNDPFVGPVQGLPTKLSPNPPDEVLLVCAFLDNYKCSECWHSAGVGEDHIQLRNSPVLIPQKNRLSLLYVSIGDDFLELEPEERCTFPISSLERQEEERSKIMREWMAKLEKIREETRENRLFYFFFRISFF